MHLPTHFHCLGVPWAYEMSSNWWTPNGHQTTLRELSSSLKERRYWLSIHPSIRVPSDPIRWEQGMVNKLVQILYALTVMQTPQNEATSVTSTEVNQNSIILAVRCWSWRIAQFSAVSAALPSVAETVYGHGYEQICWTCVDIRSLGIHSVIAHYNLRWTTFQQHRFTRQHCIVIRCDTLQQSLSYLDPWARLTMRRWFGPYKFSFCAV